MRHGRVNTCEKHGNSIAEMKKSHASLANEKAREPQGYPRAAREC